MLVVMIIALLASAAVHFMKDNITVAQDVKVNADVKSMGTQMMVYENLNGFLPSMQQGIAALMEKPTSEPIPRNWKRLLTEIPIDPWGNAYVFETPARRSKESYDLYSKGPDRQPNTDDDIGNWQR